MTVLRSGWAALGSLVSEDLHSTPGLARAAAESAAASDPANRALHLVDAVYAALLAGEPRRARRWIAEIAASPAGPAMDRHVRALRTWAGQLDGNWYPGNIGAETPVVEGDLNLAPAPGEPETVLIEHVVAYGPTSLLTPRIIAEGQLRRGNPAAARQMADVAINNLRRFAAYAEQTGWPGPCLWALAAQADLAHRAGRGEIGAQVLATARTVAAQIGMPGIVALTHLIEGDWWATPGSSPEALGYDLGVQRQASPGAGLADLERAAACFSAAEQAAMACDAAARVPRLWAAVHLRWATLAWLQGDHARRRPHLVTAAGAAAAAGDHAGSQLLSIHLLIADLAEGRLGERILELGSGWSPPQQGVVAGARQWAEQDGSISWCAGLGRLLERAGNLWAAEGESERASLAYLAALHLLGAAPALPSITLATAIADLDGRRNLSARALIRLERILTALPVVTDAREQMFDWSQQLEVLMSVVNVQRPRQRTAAAEHAARGLLRVRLRLSSLLEAAGVAGISGISPGGQSAALAALTKRMEARNDQDLAALAASASDESSLDDMLAILVGGARDQLQLIDVVVPLSRGEHALRRGLTAEADRWFTIALEAARQPGAQVFLEPLVLATAGRREEARARAAEIAARRDLPDDLLALLALRSDEPELAATAFARTGADPATTTDWRTALTGAEIALAADDAQRALDLACHGIDIHEDAIGRLLRDTDRVAGCDDPDATSLYLTAARACIRLASDAPAAERAAALARSFEFTERARSLAIEHLLRDGGVLSATRRAWQQAAAEWAACSDRLLAAIDASPPMETGPLVRAADAAELRLHELELELERVSPGALVERSRPGPPLRLAAVQERLPAAAVLLEYHMLGHDLLVWAVTRDGIEVQHRPVRSRRLGGVINTYHRRCADRSGAGAEADELAALLLAPVADTLAGRERVVIVPFGPLHLVPFHALPFRGEALGLSHVVSYAPAATVGVRAGFDRPIPVASAAIIGDPSFDTAFRPALRRLPGARTEAKAIAGLLGTSDPLLEDEATEVRVRRQLEGRNVAHLATHGWLDELAPYASSLVLAGRDELSVAELVGLQIGSDLAVLSACDTGRGAATLGGDVVGLARALLAAGVRHTVVSLWPVDDVTACVTMVSFYEHLIAARPPAVALASAQRFVHGLDHAGLLARYAALGGVSGTDAQSYRRGEIELDPELRDDEEIPAPAGGSAERHWAPFILFGG